MAKSTDSKYINLFRELLYLLWDQDEVYNIILFKDNMWWEEKPRE